MFCSVAVLFIVATANAFDLPSSQEILSTVPGGVSYEHVIRPMDFYKIKNSKGDMIGTAFITSNIAPVVSGYGGEIDALVGIDTEGKIASVKIISHKESPQFIKKIIDSGFLSRFIGRKTSEDFSNIEAVSGATISSQAIIDDVKTAATSVALQISGRAKYLPGSFASVPSSVWLSSAAIIAMICITIFSVVSHKRKKMRILTLVLAVLVIGILLNSPITIGDIVDVRNFTISWPTKLPLILLMLFALITSFWRGNLYCSYLCPFGALQEGAAAIYHKKCNPDSRTQKSLVWLRWIIAVVAIYAIAAMGSLAFRTVEPFALCFSREFDKTTLVQAGVVLISSIFVRRIWCRFFCPTGLVMDLLALLGSKLRHVIRRQSGAQ